MVNALVYLILLLVRTDWSLARRAKMVDEVEIPCCVRGYHVYRDIWEAAVGEVLMCHREPTNSSDRYAVAVIKSAEIIGHLPRKLSKICSLVLRRGGSIRSTVSMRYSSDLLQGGLEIPCTLLFTGDVKEVKELKKAVKTRQGLTCRSCTGTFYIKFSCDYLSIE